MLDAAPAKAGAARGAHAATAARTQAAGAHVPQSPPAELTEAELRSKIMRQVRPCALPRPNGTPLSPRATRSRNRTLVLFAAAARERADAPGRRRSSPAPAPAC